MSQITRRNFLKTSLLTAGALSLPARLWSQVPGALAQIAAGAVIVTIPILIMVLIFQRRIVSGLTAGAVKG